MSRDLDDRGRERLVNMSLEAFLQSLHLFAARWSETAESDRDDQERDAVSRKLGELLRAIDPPALADAESFWRCWLAEL